MKFISRFIKGFALAVIVMGLFTFNPQAVNKNVHSYKSHTPAIEQSMVNLGDFFVPEAMAQANTAVNQTNTTANQPKKATVLPDELLKSINKASSLINKMFNPLIYFLTRHISNFLTNDYIYRGGMGEMLQGLWVVSRNIVNIIFVLILLFLALKYIFGGDEGSDLKKTLPMFVLMLIAINFSWLGSKLILDAANVATNVAFSIPSGVQTVKPLNTSPCVQNPSEATVSGSCGVAQIWWPFDAVSHADLTQAECTANKVNDQYGKAYPTDKTKKGVQNDASQQSLICWETLNPAKFSSSNSAYQLTYGMARVQDLPKAPPGSDISKVGIGTLFAILIQLVYLVSFGALFIALVIRVAILWLFVAFSPFLVLATFLKTANLPTSDRASFSTFAKWAFAPTKVAAVWSVGFIMISAGQSAGSQIFATLDKQSNITSQVFSVQSLFMGMETLQEFIWLIMTVGIIWIGTFSILGDLEIVKELTGPIKQYGDGLFNKIATSPKWAPIIPMIDPNTGKITRTSLQKSVFNPLGRLQDYQNKINGIDVNSGVSASSRLTRASSDQIAKIQNGDLSTMRSVTGLSTKELQDEKNVLKVLKNSGKFKNKPEDVASKISNAAKNSGATNTVPAPTKPTPKTPAITEKDKQNIINATATGVEKGLKDKLGNDPAKLKKGMDYVRSLLAKDHTLKDKEDLIAKAVAHANSGT